MARGFLSGLIWGSVIAAGGAVVVSVSTPMPPPPSVASTDPAPGAPAGTAPAPVPTDRTQGTAGTQPATMLAPPPAPQAAIPDQSAQADTGPTRSPEIGEVAPLPATVAPDLAAPEVSVVPEMPPSNVLGTPALQPPQSSKPATVSTEPARPAAPVDQDPVAETAAAEAPQETADAPAQETAEAAPVSGQGSEDPAPRAPDMAVEADPGTATANATADADTDSASAPAETSAPAPEAESGNTASAAAPRIAMLPRVGDSSNDEAAAGDPAQPDEEQSGAVIPSVTPSVRIGQRAVPLTERDSAASSLPSVGPAATPAEDIPATAAVELPPIERFAAPFTDPGDKPLMSIVLIDGEESIGAEALANFPYPLSFAIDPDDPDAAAKMARYRAAGFEVLALIDMPLTATARDVETSLELALGTLSEVVGVLEGTGDGLQGNRALSDQVTAVLRDQGYGFVTQNSGLNTVQKLAARAGVPSAFVFRDFDGAGQTPTVMRRFLDQAAFRAGQEGAVIMQGRVRPDTISALLLWGLQDRASRVTLAPVSAVLTQQVALRE